MATAHTETESSKPKIATPDFLSHGPKKLLIGGKWVPAKSGKTFETINPATEEVLGLIAEGDKADVDEAVKSARAAYEGKWSLMNPHERARLLFKSPICSTNMRMRSPCWRASTTASHSRRRG